MRSWRVSSFGAIFGLALLACSFNEDHGAAGGSGTGGSVGGQGGNGSGTGTGGVHVTGSGTGGRGGASAELGTGGATGSGGAGGDPYSNPGGGVITCMPGVAGTAITDCGYPYASATPLTNVVFNELEVLRAIQPAGTLPAASVRLFYNDEHALTLGVRRVVVKDATGTTNTDYPVSALASDPGSVTNAQLGTNELVGDQSGLDQSLRPMWPVLFVTDVSADPTSHTGDWQMGGVPQAPTAVFGSWKSAIRTVDKTVSPVKVTITPDADPVKNNWNLGTDSDAVPAGLTNQGFGAEVRWDVTLTPGHSYRLQVMVHDGDQNKGGGDSGEACVIYCAGGSSSGAGGSGGSTPASCPTGFPACGNAGGIEPLACPAGTICANGCCLPSIDPTGP